MPRSLTSRSDVIFNAPVRVVGVCVTPIRSDVIFNASRVVGLCIAPIGSDVIVNFVCVIVLTSRSILVSKSDVIIATLIFIQFPVWCRAVNISAEVFLLLIFTSPPVSVISPINDGEEVFLIALISFAVIIAPITEDSVLVEISVVPIVPAAVVPAVVVDSVFISSPIWYTNLVSFISEVGVVML